MADTGLDPQTRCIFDSILAGEVDVERVYEDDAVLAFRDIAPQAPVHVLIVPKTRASSLQETTSWSLAALGELLQGVTRTAAHLGLRDGYRVVINQGKHGGQEIAYLHVHLLAGRVLRWPPG